jgi:hypothetical protein
VRVESVGGECSQAGGEEVVKGIIFDGELLYAAAS